MIENSYKRAYISRFKVISRAKVRNFFSSLILLYYSPSSAIPRRRHGFRRDIADDKL